GRGAHPPELTTGPAPGNPAPLPAVVRPDRLPHSIPYGCEDGDCTNRAMLRLTLDTGQQLNLFRPHAAQYPAPSTAPIASATADRTVPAAQDPADTPAANQPRSDVTPAPTPSTVEAPACPAVPPI